MSYNHQIQKIRLQLIQLITESVKACNNHISTYYKSTGVPYSDVVKIKAYESVPLRGTFNFRWDIESNVIMHLSIRKKKDLDIIYNNGLEEQSTTIDKLTLESLYDIVKWLQSEMLLLAPRKEKFCYFCGSSEVNKIADVAINKDNIFLRYNDEVGVGGNWCVKCGRHFISYLEFDQTNIPMNIINHWWCDHTEEQKITMLRGLEIKKEHESFTPNERWFCMPIDIKRKIWCNYRDI